MFCIGVLRCSSVLALENISSNYDNFSYDRTHQFYPSDSNGLPPPTGETLKYSEFADISCIPYGCETAGRNGEVSSLYRGRREEQVVGTR